ncbi:MAG: capsular biosynthesis protein CpsE [Desulfatitalea sp. BRH_c12]|nr:MAG: capsular biosynthesis protein CpsE [Desulfatitalea sp. BRH_c12]
MLRLFKQYYPIRNALFVLGEGCIIFLSVIAACWIILGEKILQAEISLFMKALLITFSCQLCLYYNDLYDLKITSTFSELGIRLLQALGAAAIILAILYFLFPNVIISEGIFLVSTVIVILFVVSWRVAYTQVLNKGLFNQRIIILGSSETAKEIARQIQETKDCGYEIAAAISKDAWHDVSCSENFGVICLNSYENICELATQMKVERIVVALKEKRGDFPIEELLKCRVNGIDIIEGNSFYEMLTGKLIVEQINPGWLIFAQGFQKSKSQRFVKRTIDLILSITMLILLMPLLVVIAIIIKLDSKGPIIFSQERVGEKHKPYMVHKFRSMRCDAEKDTGPVWAQANDDRITRIGHFMRKWRIDEIPQLWNVLKGEMSFVGPRPEREYFVKELTKTIPYYGERFSVKPGVTGWAQVCYGYGASVRDAIEKLNYDLFYIKNMSILMDIMIYARTIKTVLFGKGR